MALPDSPTFCILPWVHGTVMPDSSVVPCCEWPLRSPVGDARTRSLEEIWNDAPMRELRLRMLRGEKIPECSKCYLFEEAGLMSLRRAKNHTLAHLASAVASTAPDGSSSLAHVASLDLRLGNLCNFRCRGCDPSLSNSWYDDFTTLEEVTPGHPRTLHVPTDSPGLWERLQGLLPHVEEVFFAGGEPLLLPEHAKLLRLLADAGRTDVRLGYSTNLSVLELGGRRYGELWEKFQHVHVMASLDDLGARAEYFRHGTRWETVAQNLEQLKTRFPHVRRTVNSTVSLFNVYYLPELMEWLADSGHVSPDDFYVNLLSDPVFYGVRVLPPEFKLRVARKLEAHMHLWRASGDPRWRRAIYEVQSVLVHMREADHSHWLPQALSRIQRLDALRGESFREVYPEMADLLEHSPTAV